MRCRQKFVIFGNPPARDELTEVPLQIHFHNLEPSDAVESSVRKRVGRLERYCDEIVSCRVTIEAPHKHHHQGNMVHVTIDVRTPGDESIASRAPAQHSDVDIGIAELFPAGDYGTITDSDGREIYFHRNSVVNADFDSLTIDSEVRFVEESGEKGPQASSVHLIGKHHIVG
jgi:cold shock CspA family protein/ribosome-associated translation inhibitor RaiA